MSENASILRRKIDSATNLQSVVRTMKAMAASSIHQYERSVQALADYYRTVELGLSVCLRATDTLVSTPWKDRTTKKNKSDVIYAVVFGSDQGLVGRFNDVVACHAIETLEALPTQSHIWAVGERVHGCLANEGMKLLDLFTVPNSVKVITLLVGQILVKFEEQHSEEEIGELYLFYNRPTAEAVFTPISQRLLPLDARWQQDLAQLPWPTGNLPEIIGSGTKMLQALIGEYLFVSLFRACAESLASENASRLAAMQRADENIDELLTELNGVYHRLRQSSIDEELFDVIAGFEALSGGKM